MRARNKIFLLLVVALAVVAGWPVEAHFRAKWKLAGYQRKLKAAGEKLAFEEIIPPSPKIPNSAHAFVMAVSRLGMATTNLPPMVRYAGKGHALVGWKQPALPTWNTTNVWPGVTELIEDNEAALAEIRASLQGESLQFDLDYTAGFSLQLPHLARFRQAAQWLAAAVLVDLRAGRPVAALKNLKALTALVTRFRDEPFMVSVLVRVNVAQIALDTMWEALQFPDWQDEQLAQLQAAWESLDLPAHVETALAMERMMSRKVFVDGRESFAAIRSTMNYGAPGTATSGVTELAELGKEVVRDPESAVKTFVHRFPGYLAWKWWWSYEDELVSAQMTQLGMDVARSGRAGHALSPLLKQLDGDTARLRKSHPRAGNWLGYSPVQSDAIHRLLLRVSRLELQRRLLLTAIALERHRHRHGQYPAELAALVAEFLREPPLDAMDGQPLRYRLQPDGAFQLYSVGEDGEDNGGDATIAETSGAGPRLWYRGRDAVWPQPASAEEAEAYLQTMAGRWQAREAERTGGGRALGERRGTRERNNGLPSANPLK